MGFGMNETDALSQVNALRRDTASRPYRAGLQIWVNVPKGRYDTL